MDEHTAQLLEVADLARLAWHKIDDATKQRTIALLRAQLRGPDGWPRVYVNGETGRIYKPHNEQERSAVYSDDPRYLLVRGGEGGGKSVAGIIKTLNRIRRGMSGLMCCVAPETMIEGVPLGDRTRPTLVQTLQGPAWGSAGIREGRADLFRVVTESGESVTVTKNHRFLTPNGWRPLRSLRVGDAILADGSSHVRAYCEKLPSSQDDCLMDRHPCGELSSHAERHILDRARRPAWSVAGSAVLADCHCHAYTGSSSFLENHGADVSEPLPFCDCDEMRCCLFCAFPTIEQGAFQHGNLQRWRPDSKFADLGSVYSKQIAHAREECGSYGLQSSRLPQQCLQEASPGQTALQCGLSSVHPYDHYIPKVRWAQIESVTFQRFGEFWDLSVPGPQHYLAHGLFHHNSPNLPHLRRSLWPEFRRWCPWDRVVKKHQRFGHLDWEPHEPWNIVFKNGVTLHCTGIENPGSLEGPNINFAHFDEARHHPDGKALKVLDGRVRIPGPKGEPPQIFLTTTPARNWLYTYFGPLEEDDPFAGFKADARDIVLLTRDNEENLFEGFADARAQTLTAKEARVLLEAAWEDLSDGQPFLPDMTWWDNCKEKLPPLTPREPMVIGVDAATGRTTTSSDCFAIVGVTRHPDRNRGADTIAVRYAKTWQARAGHKIDYRGTWDNPGPERELLRLCGYDMDAGGTPVPIPGKGYNVLAVVYDPTELHDMAARLYRAGASWFKEFSQGTLRNESDRQLLELIQQQRVAHDGNQELRDHIKNADRKTDESGHRMRIVKRVDSLKVDLAVSLSMAAHEAMRLNL